MDLSFVADENIEKHVVEKLQRKGFRVTYVAEINPVFVMKKFCGWPTKRVRSS